jgi:hypothetical protein
MLCDNRSHGEREALYHIRIQADQIIDRLYCRECTERLFQGVAKVLEDHDSRAIHEVVEVEYA